VNLIPRSYSVLLIDLVAVFGIIGKLTSGSAVVPEDAPMIGLPPSNSNCDPVISGKIPSTLFC